MEKREINISSHKEKAYDAVVVLGHVEDYESVLPGFNYAFSHAVERWVGQLKGRGYKNVDVFREPDTKSLRRILSRQSLKAVVFIGHGQREGKKKKSKHGYFSFHLNRDTSISGQDFRLWALEDSVMPGLSQTAKKIVEDESDFGFIKTAMLNTASYNFDLSVVHACHSLSSPDMRSALGGEFQGNSGLYFLNLSPRSYVQYTLRVCSEAFTEDPLKALQGAMVQTLNQLDKDKSSLVMPGFRSAVRRALAELIEARKHQGAIVQTRVLNSLQERFSVDFISGQEYEDLSPEEVKKLLSKDWHTHEDEVLDCLIPTKSSQGKLGCRRRVKAVWPCWQHRNDIVPPQR